MSVKKDLLAEIEAKARKIKERRAKTACKEDVEKTVFDYFREVELLGRLRESSLVYEATVHLRKTIQQKFDWHSSIEISYTEQNQVQGVLITWSKNYQHVNNTSETMYIGVEHMLLCDI